MRSFRLTKKILTAASVGVLAIATISLGVFMNSRTTDAAVAGWNAGNIITDSVFTNKTTMNASQIQAFLNSKVPSCDTWGTQPSEYGGGTRRQWAEARGYNAPFTCLRDYRQGGKNAAQIIYETAQKYTINPQVLLVLLQKEQGLVTDTWPLSIQYRSATGYGCPDNAACDADYYGFANQVKWAAIMFRAILDDSPTWYTPYELGWNYIQYNPDKSCGGSNVYIHNRATQALYNYTPYQPNTGALNAGWGTAHCGSYGNRNFYLYFTSWFGSTRDRYVSLSPKRWMRAKTTTRKVDIWTGQQVDGTIAAGTQLRFVDKIKIDGEWYLRTAYDSAHKLHKGVLLSDLGEIPYESMAAPGEHLQVIRNSYKHTPNAELRNYNNKFDYIAEDDILLFTSKITINGNEYYRTKYDTDHSLNKGIPTALLRQPAFEEFEEPRYMEIKNATNKVNPVTGAEDAANLAKGQQLKFTSKIRANGKWYYRTESDTASNAVAGVPASDIREVPYQSYSPAKWLRLNTNAAKVNPATGTVASSTLGSGTQLKITQKITINGAQYYRTEYDARHGLKKAIPASSFEELAYVPLEEPRNISLKRTSEKLNPVTGQPTGERYGAGRSIAFSTKIYVNGGWYLRSEYDTNHGLEKALPMSHLNI